MSSEILINVTPSETRAVVVTDSGHVVLSAVQPETIAHRFGSPKAATNGGNYAMAIDE